MGSDTPTVYRVRVFDMVITVQFGQGFLRLY